jgi:hypothetical protein
MALNYYYWVPMPCPSFGILKGTFRKLDLFPKCCVLFRIPNNGQNKKSSNSTSMPCSQKLTTSPIQISPAHTHTSVQSILISSSYLRLDLPSFIFPSDFPATFSISHVYYISRQFCSPLFLSNCVTCVDLFV